MRLLATLAGAAVLLAACAAREPEPLKISDISVTADLPAIGSRQATTYWTNLDRDLEAAIASEFVGYIDPLGKRVTVDVDELSLATPFATGATAETARLTGRVELLNLDGTSVAAYDVTATSQDVATYLPPGSTLVSIPPTSAEYYQAIVKAFARGTANTLRAAGS